MGRGDTYFKTGINNFKDILEGDQFKFNHFFNNIPYDESLITTKE